MCRLTLTCVIFSSYLFCIGLSAGSTSGKFCNGGLDSNLPETIFTGCDNKCVYELDQKNNVTFWKPSTPVTFSVADGPVYFSSLTCPSDKKSVMMEIESPEKEFTVCVAPKTAGTCFGQHSLEDGSNIEGLKCFKTGGLIGGNDGLMKVGEGTWVFGMEHQKGNDEDIILESIRFECTDKEGAWWLKYALYGGGAAAALIVLCCAWRCGLLSCIYDIMCCLMDEDDDKATCPVSLC